MRESLIFFAKALARGLLIVIPIYLTALFLLKAMSSVAQVVRPLSHLFPNWFPGERVLSLLLVLAICFLIGLAIRTRKGRRTQELVEKTVLERIPGYAVIRSLTHSLAGDEQEEAWRPAFAEIEKGLAPCFIIEEFEDGRFTVFVPSVPTPLAGEVYVLEANRVHPLDVPLTQQLQVMAKWGSGAKSLVAAMEGTPASQDTSVPDTRTAHGLRSDLAH